MLKNIKSLAFPFRLLGFWLIFFGAFRLWFVLWFSRYWPADQPESVWGAFWHGLPLDFSFAAYLMAIPVLLWLFGLLIGEWAYAGIDKSITALNVLFFGVFIFVFGANLFVYEEWQTPLNNRAVEYFKTPSALLDSMSFGFKLVCLGLYLGGCWLIWTVYRKVVGQTAYSGEGLSRWLFLSLPLWIGLLVLAIRGGLGVMPINESAVYYSTHLFNNHAATNPGWSLGHSLVETRSTENRFKVMPDEEAKQRTENLKWQHQGEMHFDFRKTSLTPDSVPVQPPVNLVVLMLESHTAQVVEELGGMKGVCPNMSGLIRDGILFENVYGSGYRTDQGLVSVLAGYPAQPDQSIILLDDKASGLISLPGILKDNGYQSMFMYGGELTFANLGLWLTHQRFDQIISERDFPSEQKTQRWGVDDRLMLQRFLQQTNALKEPFMAAALTLSLHPPYDVPFTSQWSAQTDAEKFLNSAAFVDQAIGEFFSAAAQQPWFERTIFVLVADHGSAQPGGFGMDRPESRRIPLIIYGKPLLDSWKGKRIKAFGNHHDIMNTLIPVLNPNKKTGVSKGLWWSRNLIELDDMERVHAGSNPALGFAYYTNENGLGWATPYGKGFYEFKSKEWRIFEGQLSEEDKLNAQAYLQTLYNDFLTR
ncbi:MAG TPA: sulfatase-like hydrolase/transferase [Saprospiraceae bacterium]|nr:sulfatase-like hydrolase/transferase [Saprospiraceae bacterium]